MSCVNGLLVGVSVLSMWWLDCSMVSAMASPLLSSVGECHMYECELTSAVRTVFGVFISCVMFCCVFVM